MIWAVSLRNARAQDWLQPAVATAGSCAITRVAGSIKITKKIPPACPGWGNEFY
jgi:hypothetical protein